MIPGRCDRAEGVVSALEDLREGTQRVRLLAIGAHERARLPQRHAGSKFPRVR